MDVFVGCVLLFLAFNFLGRAVGRAAFRLRRRRLARTISESDPWVPFDMHDMHSEREASLFRVLDTQDVFEGI